jgi:hypothetical protein
MMYSFEVLGWNPILVSPKTFMEMIRMLDSYSIDYTYKVVTE